MLIYSILKKQLQLEVENSAVWVIFVSTFESCVYYHVVGNFWTQRFRSYAKR